jgi:hypothetical protein
VNQLEVQGDPEIPATERDRRVVDHTVERDRGDGIGAVDILAQLLAQRASVEQPQHGREGLDLLPF